MAKEMDVDGISPLALMIMGSKDVVVDMEATPTRWDLICLGNLVGILGVVDRMVHRSNEQISTLIIKEILSLSTRVARNCTRITSTQLA